MSFKMVRACNISLVFTSTLFPHQASKLFQHDARHTRPGQAQQANLSIVCETLSKNVVTISKNG